MSYVRQHALMLELIALAVAIVLPISVHAGVFDMLFAAEPIDSEPIFYANEDDAQSLTLLRAATHIDPNPAKGGGDVLVDEGSLVPQLITEDDIANSPTANGEISVYVVREGDTLSQIAEMFDVSANTILWANDIAKASLIQPGDSLVILPITGIRHVVKDGDTISTIAKKYEGDIDEILSYNQLASADGISIGDTVVIPGGAIQSAPAPSRSYATPVRTSGTVATGGGSAGFSHPLPGSVKSQGIHGYNGIDLAAGVGATIYAAAGGEVIVSKGSGWNGGYGLYVVIKHPNGTQTLYAHNSANLVGVGERVVSGQAIARVGNTGRSTGPHLHFEVRGARNPF